MVPSDGSISRLIIFKVVDLPQPEGPTKQQIWPRPTVRVTSSTARVPSGKVFPTLLNSIIASPRGAPLPGGSVVREGGW
jgi:hypothetical protein